MASRKSVGSILKPLKVRVPLKEIEVEQEDEENTATSIKRKVSFSGMNKIKMYNTGATSLTVHQAPMIDEQISMLSDSSNTEKTKVLENSEKSDGQITFEATICTNIESNARVIIEYESPNDNMEMTEALSGNLISNTIYSIDNNGSEYIDYKSDYSDGNMEMTEALYTGQVITTNFESDYSSTEMSQSLNDDKLETPFENVSTFEQPDDHLIETNDINSLSLIKDDSLAQNSKKIDDPLSNNEYSNQEVKELKINSAHDSVYRHTASLTKRKMSLSGTNKIKMYNINKLSLKNEPVIDEKMPLLVSPNTEKCDDQIVESSTYTNMKDNKHCISKYEYNNMELTEAYSGKLLSDTIFITDKKGFEQINNTSNPYSSDSDMDITKAIQNNQDILADIESDLSSTEMSETLSDKDEQLKIQSVEISNSSVNYDVNSLSMINVDSLTQKSNESDDSITNERQELEDIKTNNIYDDGIYKYTSSLSKRKMSISGTNNIKMYNSNATSSVAINKLSMLNEETTELCGSTNNKKVNLSKEFEKCDDQSAVKLSHCIQNDNIIPVECISSNDNKQIPGQILPQPIYNIDNCSQLSYKCNDNSLDNSEIKMDFTETLQVGQIVTADIESDLSSSEVSRISNNKDKQLKTQNNELLNSTVNSLSFNKLIENGQLLSNVLYSNEESNKLFTNNECYNVTLSLMDVDLSTKRLNETVKSQCNEIEMDFTETIQVHQNIVVDDIESDLSSTKMTKTLNNKQFDIQYKELSNSSSFNKSIIDGPSLSNALHSNEKINEINTNNVYSAVSLSFMDVDSPTRKLNETDKSKNNEIEMDFTETIKVGQNVESELNYNKMSETLNNKDKQLETQNNELSNCFNKSMENDYSLCNEIIYSNQETNEINTNNVYNEMDKEKIIIIPNELDKNGKQIDHHGNGTLKENDEIIEEKINNDSKNIICDGKTILNSKQKLSSYSIDKITNEICIEDISNMSISDDTNERDEKFFMGNRKRSYNNINYAPLSCSSFMSKSNIQNCTIGDIRESPIRKKITKEDSINKEYVMENIIEKELIKEDSVDEYLCNDVLEFLTRWNEQFVEKELVLNKCRNSEWVFSVLDNNIILTISYSPILNDHSFLKVDNIVFTHTKTQNEIINFGINWILSKYNPKVYKQICFTSRDVELLLKSLLEDVQFISKVMDNISYVKDLYCVKIKDDKAQFILHSMNNLNGPLMVRIELSLTNIHKFSVKHITADVIFGFFDQNVLEKIIEDLTKDCYILQSFIENLKKQFK